MSKRTLLPFLLLVPISIAVSFPLYLTGLLSLDEGAVFHIAERLGSGEVLYRDVATGTTPGIYYLVAWLFRIFGPAMQVPRILRRGLVVDALVWVNSPRQGLTTKQGGFSKGARTIMHKWRREHPDIPVHFAGAAVHEDGS